MTGELRQRWIWLLGLGILLDLLGLIALGSAFYISLRTLGWFLILVGVLRAVQCFRLKHRSGYIGDLLTAVLYTMVGVLMVAKPDAGALPLPIALVIALLLMVDGAVQITGSIMAKYPNWRWLLVNGILVLLFGLGLAIWHQFLQHMFHLRIWVIAWFLGITMLLHGSALIVLGWAGRNQSETPQ